MIDRRRDAQCISPVVFSGGTTVDVGVDVVVIVDVIGDGDGDVEPGR
jgi:hypothetical protein